MELLFFQFYPYLPIEMIILQLFWRTVGLVRLNDVNVHNKEGELIA